jgi:hypothetical protein
LALLQPRTNSCDNRPVKYNHVVKDEGNNEEEYHDYVDQEHVAHVVDVLDKEVEEVDHPNVGGDDLIDDIHNYSSENDVDDDVDRNEPFTNIDSEPNLDTDVELDEEEDGWYLIVEKKRYAFISFI